MRDLNADRTVGGEAKGRSSLKKDSLERLKIDLWRRREAEQQAGEGACVGWIRAQLYGPLLPKAVPGGCKAGGGKGKGWLGRRKRGRQG